MQTMIQTSLVLATILGGSPKRYPDKSKPLNTSLGRGIMGSRPPGDYVLYDLHREPCPWRGRSLLQLR